MMLLLLVTVGMLEDWDPVMELLLLLLVGVTVDLLDVWDPVLEVLDFVFLDFDFLLLVVEL